MKADTILATIGNTPHIRMQRLFGNTHGVGTEAERATLRDTLRRFGALGRLPDAALRRRMESFIDAL